MEQAITQVPRGVRLSAKAAEWASPKLDEAERSMEVLLPYARVDHHRWVGGINVIRLVVGLSRHFEASRKLGRFSYELAIESLAHSFGIAPHE